MKDLGTITRTS